MEFNLERIMQIKKEFGAVEHSAISIYEDIPRYSLEDVISLHHLQMSIFECDDSSERAKLIEQFATKKNSITPLPNPPQRIYLWPNGVMPQSTEYKDNQDFKYNHDPDFHPYLFELLLPDDVLPKGAVICIAGGDHGHCTLTEAYQVCIDFNRLGYQCFLLNNRTNHNPWNEKDSGVDASRAVRFVRANSDKYRINKNQVAIAGFSNGGITGENCILHYSGNQTVADHFTDYQPDELDQYYGAPDAMLCIYGPRFKDKTIDFTNVVYPPTFFAVGREDFAMTNLNYIYPILVEHGVPVEIHTFAGTPHGVAGLKLVDGYTKYPNFELWLTLADSFMQDVYKKAQK